MINMLAKTSATGRLKVVVRLDADLSSALIEVRGTVTSQSLKALYVVTRRTNAFLPGREVTIDLSRARVEASALEALCLAAHDRKLPSTIDPANTPCTLTILEPGTHALAA